MLRTSVVDIPIGVRRGQRSILDIHIDGTVNDADRVGDPSDPSGSTPMAIALSVIAEERSYVTSHLVLNEAGISARMQEPVKLWQAVIELLQDRIRLQLLVRKAFFALVDFGLIAPSRALGRSMRITSHPKEASALIEFLENLFPVLQVYRKSLKLGRYGYRYALL